jgi:hypothetical protein
MDNKLGQSILEKIKEEKLAPKARWKFLFKDYTIWGFGFLSLLIGSFSVAVILYMLSFNDWGIHKELEQSLLSYIIISMPYFWLVFLGLFILVVYYNFKHTKHGYRYSLPLIIGVSVLTSVLLGGFFFALGMGEAIDDVLSRQTPFYENIINHRVGMWRSPESGMLAGMVIEKQNDKLIVVFAMDRELWQVDIGDAKIMISEGVVVGKPIKAIGKTVGDLEFRANILMPVGPGKEFFKREHDRFRIPPMGGLRPMEMMK